MIENAKFFDLTQEIKVSNIRTIVPFLLFSLVIRMATVAKIFGKNSIDFILMTFFIISMKMPAMRSTFLLFLYGNTLKKMDFLIKYFILAGISLSYCMSL